MTTPSKITLPMMRENSTAPSSAMPSTPRASSTRPRASNCRRSPAVPTLVGRCRTTLWADMAHDDPHPYALELQAVDAWRPDDVLIAAAGGSMRSGIWGELLPPRPELRLRRRHRRWRRPRHRQDADMRFPVFAQGTCLYDSKDRQRVIDLDIPVEIDGVSFYPRRTGLRRRRRHRRRPASDRTGGDRQAWEKVHAENKTRDEIKAGMKATAVFEKYGIL